MYFLFFTQKNDYIRDGDKDEDEMDFVEIYGLDIKLEPAESSANVCSILCPYLSRGNVSNGSGGKSVFLVWS